MPIQFETACDVPKGFAKAKEDNKPFSSGFELASLGFPASYLNSAQHDLRRGGMGVGQVVIAVQY